MSTHATTLEDSLKLLQTEHRSAAAQLRDLEAEISRRRQRVEDLERAINALHSVLGVVPEQTESTDSPGGEGSEQALEAPASKPTRIRSTDAAVRIVAEAERPLTRDDIRNAFHEQGLVPDSWKTPVNAINNAIARAVEKGLIRETGDGRFTVMREEPPISQTPTWALQDFTTGGSGA